MPSKIRPTAKRLNRVLMGSAVQALKSTVRKGLTFTFKQSVKNIRRNHAALPASDVKAFIKLDRDGIKGRTIKDVKGLAIIESRPISFIRLVVGPKEPAKQKGVAVKSRKKVRVRIKPGLTLSKDLFIARVEGGKQGRFNQVFTRKKKSDHIATTDRQRKQPTQLPIRKRALSSAQRFMSQPDNHRDMVKVIEKNMAKDFEKLFIKTLEKRIAKLQVKRSG